MRSLAQLENEGDEDDRDFVREFYDLLGVVKDDQGRWKQDSRWRRAENYWERAVKAALKNRAAQNQVHLAEVLARDALLQGL